MKAAEIYTAYQAKSHFSELLRNVRAKRQIIITHHGKAVALLSPVEPTEPSIETTIASGIDTGIISPPRGKLSDLATVERRPGALERFLDERE